MKKLYILFLLLMPSVLVFNACGDGEPVPPPTTSNQWPKDWYIPQDVLDYFYFKQGSYWVYENNKTGDLDSVFVINNVKTFTNPTQQGERYEVAAIDAVSSLDGYTYKYGLSMQGSSNCIKNGAKNPCYVIMCNKFKTGDVLGESLSLILPFKRNYGGVADFSSQSSLIKMTEERDSILLGSYKFYEVKISNITNSLVANRKNIDFYWAKYVGIILKKNLTDNENWNLIRYHIIK